jgi:hypothetical protein
MADDIFMGGSLGILQAGVATQIESRVAESSLSAGSAKRIRNAAPLAQYLALLSG